MIVIPLFYIIIALVNSLIYPLYNIGLKSNTIAMQTSQKTQVCSLCSYLFIELDPPPVLAHNFLHFVYTHIIKHLALWHSLVGCVQAG